MNDSEQIFDLNETAAEKEFASYEAEYDYGKVIDRSGTYSMKWDDGNEILPFWVADMDIVCSPAIVEAINKRAESPIYGYTDIPDEWANAYSSWFQSEHGWNLQPEELIYTNGIICGLSSMVRRFSEPHEKVIVMTPVYPIFFNSIVNNGREPLEVPLAYSSDDRSYAIDFEALKAAMEDPQASLMILCNPHNPTGNLWSKEELNRIADLAEANGVLIISDEVHCDIVRPGYAYTPFASVSEKAAMNAISLLSPSKAFNVAGIHAAAAAAYNPVIRHRAWRAINTDEVGEPNVFSIQTAIAAYTKSLDWLKGLQAYLFENRDYAVSFIESEMKLLSCIRADALYLLWIDASELPGMPEDFVDFLCENFQIRLSSGTDFKGNGESFIRMNLACPKSMLEEGLRRFKAGYQKWIEIHQ